MASTKREYIEERREKLFGELACLTKAALLLNAEADGTSTGIPVHQQLEELGEIETDPVIKYFMNKTAAVLKKLPDNV